MPKIIAENNHALIGYEGEIDPFLDDNADLRSQPQSRKSDFRHVARIPNIIALSWLNEEWNRGHDIRYGGAEWMELVAKKLQDPDWAFLKVEGPKQGIGWGD